MNNVMELIKPSIINKRLDYVIEQIDDVPPNKLLGYSLMIERILINLLGNAVKFTDSGKITLQYGWVDRIRSNGQNSHQLHLVVSDTGKGIPTDKQAEIFELFTRLSPSYRGIYEGEGLGLYITKKLIALMDGEIIVESSGEGEGSVFSCFIPVEQLTSEVEKQSIQEKDSSYCYRILLAEDNKTARMAASMILKRVIGRCEVDEADSIQSIIQFTTENCYDLILMDINFPDEGSLVTAKGIRTSPLSKNQQTPIPKSVT
ncbi:MAG: hypothetical protein GY821_09175 [Gammaproteobacteria bacterium]|nr:hypothetical protein [Gammaproteobacteria bacterium]